jgi:DNA invertase Pin-like site-specific DNA recombinase
VEDAAALRTLGAAHVVIESSADSRAARRTLADHLRPGDTLIASSPKRLAARMADLVRLALDLRERGIRIVCEGAPSLAREGDDIDQVLRDLVSFQDQHVGAQVRNSLQTSTARVGRPPVLSDEDLERAAAMRRDSRTYREIGEALGVSAAAVSRALARGSRLPKSD